MTNPWHTLSMEQAALELGTDVETGLTRVEAEGRQARYGPNRLPEVAATSPWRIFFDQFKSIMTVLLLAAASIALLLGDELEAVSILIVLLLNALLGFINEYRAERSVNALKALTVPMAEVVRDGEAHEVPGAQLTLGDLISFEAGDRIPADGRLTEAWNLQVDESALTGESLAANKNIQAILSADTPLAERQTMVYTGTSVVQGRGQAIVTATGINTEIGKISSLLGSVKEEQSPLQNRLDRLGRYLALAALGIAALVVAAGLLRGEEFLSMLETSLALAIAAVPEGLAAVATIALALGMRRMAQRQAIVRRLASVETLGSTNVICTDKTGTLTQNQMTVREVRLGKNRIQVSGSGYEPKGEFSSLGTSLDPQGDFQLLLTLRAGLLCNTADLEREENGQWDVVGDPTEGALVVVAAKAGLDAGVERDAYPKVDENPFDTRERRMATVHKLPDYSSQEHQNAGPGEAGDFITFVKGAPEAILPLSTRQQCGMAVEPLRETEWDGLWEINTEMAGQALRVLALAYKRTTYADEDPYQDLIFLGFVGMIDPPRPEAGESIRQCQEAGIRVVMITGDQKMTAGAIATELGILQTDQPRSMLPQIWKETNIVDGKILDETGEAALRELVEETTTYARVSPEHKLRIVRALQENGQVVAMTGDGVNDAPALKAADIGVAMGRMGTDVAREAADMVLANDNFATIVAAVEEGRVVFANVRKFVHYLFSCNLSEILVIFIATLAGMPMPLLPLQILWLNLITDVFPALALAGEPAEPGIMRRPPPSGVKNQHPPASFLRSVVAQGGLLAASTLVAFIWTLGSSPDVNRATTVAFLSLGFAQLFHVFNSRFESGSALRQGLLSNRYILAAIALTTVLMLLAIYLPVFQLILQTVPPSTDEWLVIIIAALLPALVVEGYKLWPKNQ